MLGYVKCDEMELKVKHHRLYGAVYCGLCHSIKTIRAYVLLPYFSFDFVFLALVRMLVLGEEMKLEKERCLFHPFRKGRQRMANNKSLEYSAYASLVLTIEKMKDDLIDRDSSYFRRLLIFLTLPFLKWEKRSYEKKKGIDTDLSKKLSANLSEGRALENQKADLDAMCSNFGQCLSLLFSFQTTGTQERLLSGIGDYLGRFLYTLDALDDREKDLQSGAFNPILVKNALPNDQMLSDLDMVLSYYVSEMKKILDLTDSDPALYALCDNIICCGLPAAAKKILKPKRGDQNERSL